MREKSKNIVEHPYFSKTIMLVIILNALLIGLETYPSIYNSNVELFRTLDNVVLLIFIVEMVLKLSAYRFEYFRDGWNLFDFGIVMLSIVFINTNIVSVLRIVRVLRILRTITAFPSLRRLVKVLFMSVPAMGSTLFLIGILFYIYAIIGTFFFSSVAPQYFGNLQLSFLTLFQVFTLDSWASLIFRPIFESISWSWIYFSSFILLTAYIFVNLFFGELVNNAQKIAEDTEEDKEDDLQKELRELKEQNDVLNSKLDYITNLINDKKEEKIS